jgi:hypothetical protein
MPKLRVHNFSISLDCYAAGVDQSLDRPFGVGGEGFHNWAFATRTFHQMLGMEGGADSLDDRFAAQGDIGISWKGLWGDNRSDRRDAPGVRAHPPATRRAALRRPRRWPVGLRMRQFVASASVLHARFVTTVPDIDEQQ